MSIPWFKFLQTLDREKFSIALTAHHIGRSFFPLSQYVWHNLDGPTGNEGVPNLAAINAIVRDDQNNGFSSSEGNISGIPTVLTGIEFIQANIYLSSNSLLTLEHMGQFLDWINQVDGRWILKALLLPRLPTTEIFATNLLPCAARANDLEAVRFLLYVGASPNTANTTLFFPHDSPFLKSKPYESALCEAIRNGNISIVRLLLENGAEVNPYFNHPFHGYTPLQEAILSTNASETVEILFKHGARVDPVLRPDLQFGEGTPPPLGLAVFSGKVPSVQMLSKAGALVNRWTLPYGTPLQTAVITNNMEMLHILIQEKAYVDAPADLSMWSQNFRYEYLYDPISNTRSWLSPLVLAARNGNMAMIKVLLKAGADINVCVGDGNKQYLWDLLNSPAIVEDRSFGDIVRQITNTALQTALYREHVELVRFLLESGASVNMHKYGDNLLQIAARCNNIDLIKLLLFYGAQVCTPALWPFERTAVQAAAEKGNLAILRTLLDAMTDTLGYLSINEGPSPIGGRTALQGAAGNGHVEMVECLLALGADVNGPTAEQHGLTTLQAAARSRNLVIAELVLAAGADTDTLYGTPSALAIAIERNDLAMFNILLRYNLDITTRPAKNKMSILGLAVISTSNEFLQALISRGADVNTRWHHNHEEVTALHTAIRHCRIDAVKLLVQAGADVNADGRRGAGEALLSAVEEDSLNIAEFLLQAGDNVSSRVRIGLQYSNTGAATIAEAAFYTNIDMVTMLLQYGAEPSAEADGDNTALANAVMGSSRSNPVEGLVQLLIDAGANVNDRCVVEPDEVLPGSILAVAAQLGSLQLVQLLTASGAEPNCRYSLDDWTALQCAIASGHDDIVHVILEAGADINASPSKEYGRTALQEAASQGDSRYVRLLLQRSADVNAPAGKVRGVTALQAASIQGHLAVVVQLLHAGADINGKPSENQGRTSLQGAAEWGLLDIVCLLFENNLKMEGFYDRCQDAASYAHSERHAVIRRILLNYRKP